MRSLSEKEMRTLVGLLDDEDPRSLDLVRGEILKIGKPILPFLDDLRASCSSDLTRRVDTVISELRTRDLHDEFKRLAGSPDCDLETGVWLISRIGFPGVRPAVYMGWLDKVAGSVRKALPMAADAYTTMQQLNIHLFQELGFEGNETRYYDPENTYLNRVIETRRGIPVSLSVLYLLISKRLGLPVHGVGTPGHFLVGYRESSQSRFFIDPFHHGRLLGTQDVRRMLVRNGYEFRPEYLQACAPRDILARMLRNLISVYHKSGAADRAESISGLMDILLAA